MKAIKIISKLFEIEIIDTLNFTYYLSLLTLYFKLYVINYGYNFSNNTHFIALTTSSILIAFIFNLFFVNSSIYKLAIDKPPTLIILTTSVALFNFINQNAVLILGLENLIFFLNMFLIGLGLKNFRINILTNTNIFPIATISIVLLAFIPILFIALLIIVLTISLLFFSIKKKNTLDFVFNLKNQDDLSLLIASISACLWYCSAIKLMSFLRLDSLLLSISCFVIYIIIFCLFTNKSQIKIIKWYHYLFLSILAITAGLLLIIWPKIFIEIINNSNNISSSNNFILLFGIKTIFVLFFFIFPARIFGCYANKIENDCFDKKIILIFSGILISFIIIYTVKFVSDIELWLSCTPVFMLFFKSLSNYNLKFYKFLTAIYIGISICLFYLFKININHNYDFFNDNQNNVVTINHNNNIKFLNIDNSNQASIPINYNKPYFGSDFANQIQLALFPYILSNRFDNILLIGYGSGTTAKTIQLISPKTNLEICDINSCLFDLNHYFNYPRSINTYKDSIKISCDARFYLSQSKRKYDLIISQPCEINSLSSMHLFTKEFFQLVKNHLEDTGILVQWLQLNDISTSKLIQELYSINSVFSKFILIRPQNSGEVILICFKDNNFKFDFDVLNKKIDSLNLLKINYQLEFNNSFQFLDNIIATSNDLESLYKKYDTNNKYICDNDLFTAKNNLKLQNDFANNLKILSNINNSFLSSMFNKDKLNNNISTWKNYIKSKLSLEKYDENYFYIDNEYFQNLNNLFSSINNIQLNSSNFKISKVNKKSISTYNCDIQLGLKEFKHNNYSIAKTYFIKYLKYFPNSYYVRYLLSYCYFREYNIAKSNEQMLLITKSTPNNYYRPYYLSLIYSLMDSDLMHSKSIENYLQANDNFNYNKFKSQIKNVKTEVILNKFIADIYDYAIIKLDLMTNY